MNAIETLFAKEKAHIAYLTAGDGGIKRTLAAAIALIQGGVNMLEIGMPFSDPIADGPIIQRAAARSLLAGTTRQDVLWLAKEIRKFSDIPLILFSYYNPILSALHTNFLTEAKLAGIDGILLVDCPLEESHRMREACLNNDISLIYVITPSTPLARIRQIGDHASGFLYYACRSGTTGMKSSLPDHLNENIKAIKSVVNLPVVVGFGISNQKMVNDALNEADGIVVGSLFVSALESEEDPSHLTPLARRLFQKA